MKRRCTQNRFLVFLKQGFLFIAVSILVVIISILSVIQSKPPGKLDLIIVLGCGIRGESITAELEYRLLRAIEYANNNSETLIIVSGGQGRGESITEALAMKRYLLSRGIDEARIFMEDKSTSTEENMFFSKELADDLFDDRSYSIGFVTSGFHCYRASLYARDAGFTQAVAIPSKSYKRMGPIFYSREYLALLWKGRELAFAYLGFMAAFVLRRGGK